MQAFDLVHAVAHIVEHVVESVFLDHFARCMQQKQRVRPHVVVDLVGQERRSAHRARSAQLGVAFGVQKTAKSDFER